MGQLINMIGQKFGKLMVVGPNKWDKTVKNPRTLWQCQCECGNLHWAGRFDLIKGDTVQCKSCSSIARSNNIKKIIAQKLNFKLGQGVAAFNEILLNYKNSAKKRGLIFNLSKEEFRILTSSRCHYCNIVPSMRGGSERMNGYYIYNGIDRKNNSEGYYIFNCVACCNTCNKAKLAMGYNEFILWVKSIYGNLNSRGEI